MLRYSWPGLEPGIAFASNMEVGLLLKSLLVSTGSKVVIQEATSSVPIASRLDVARLADKRGEVSPSKRSELWLSVWSIQHRVAAYSYNSGRLSSAP